MPVYLDHAATSPIRPQVLEAYTDALRVVGNPSSIHADGQNARAILEEGRALVAASLGADPMEIVFTSGGTEAVNLGIKGLFWAARARDARRVRILVPRGEHHATIDSVEWLEAHEGAVLEWIPLDELGRIRVDALADALRGPDDVALVTALWANNEVGTVQPVAEIARIAREAGVPVHLDAIAAYGSLPIDASATDIAAISVSAHKIGGPVGIGALVVSRSATIEPLQHGGGQQRARSGTQDAAAAAAFGVAASLIDVDHVGVSALRDRLVDGVRTEVPDAVLRGDPSAAGRLPGNAHFTFPGCEGDSLLFLLDQAGFSVSTGSACQAGVPEPSHVLLAMGATAEESRGALRFTLGADTSAGEIDALLGILPEAVARARTAGLAAREPLLGR